MFSRDAFRIDAGVVVALILMGACSACTQDRSDTASQGDARPVARVTPEPIANVPPPAQPVPREQPADARTAKKRTDSRTSASGNAAAEPRAADAATSKSATPTPKDQRFEICRARLKAAHKSHVLYDLVWNGTSEPRVVVGPAFLQMASEDRNSFANTVNCFLVAGAAGQYISFDLLDWKTGNAIARYTRGEVELR